MAGGRVNGVDRGERRRWSFAGCVFDEGNWTLTVDGRRVVVETKPLELLRALLINAGKLVTKDQLMDSVWPDVEVVEASLPTAVAKLRRALGDDRRERPTIETVPRLGYRLAVPVDLLDESDPTTGPETSVTPSSAPAFLPTTPKPRSLPRIWQLAIATACLTAMLALTVWLTEPASGYRRDLTRTQREQLTALRKLDLPAVERLVEAGWDVNAPYDIDRNGALNMVLNNCEWDRDHDQRTMMFIVRTLIEAGARLDQRNAWGDTPYSIAKAQRYCGPDHPATRAIQSMCYAPGSTLGDRCLANYKRDPAGKVMRQD